MRMSLEEYNQLPERPRRAARAQRRCQLVETDCPDGKIYQSTNGAWLKVTDRAVIACLPYPISANQLWRAARSGSKQTNVLSQPAREYKTRVCGLFAPLLRQIGWQPLNRPCEARLIVQPPASAKRYSARTHPRYDVDNYSKPVLDALKGQNLLFSDDRIFVSEQVQFAKPVPDGRVWLACIFDGDFNWLYRDVPHQWLAAEGEAI